MSERINAGYTITDSIHIGNAEFVIGEHPKAPDPYVTWECSGGNNYFWGHYFSDRKSAEMNLLERAQAELTFAMQQGEKMSETARNNIGDRCDSAKMEYESFFLFEQDCLFTDKRIDKRTLPKGLHAYDIRHGDDGDPSTLEKNVCVNFYGTVVTSEPIALGRYGCKELCGDDYGFSDGTVLSLNDFLKTHPPKSKEKER